ncbi:hypothetical protein [Streptomyces sp. NPDC002855]|uniref:hypothetical protein n=1 Tax=Streptomyces sp. NPDC002855 TaxID=3154437 RepID=UPI0033197519
MPFNSAGRAKIGSAAKLGRTKWAYAKYDFAVQGGAVGVISLTGDTIPAGAHILDCVVLVDTLNTSGGSATIALKVDDATLDAAVAYNAAPYNTTGPKKVDLTRAAAPVVPTAASVVTATVATAALTAGVFRVIVEYVEVA